MPDKSPLKMEDYRLVDLGILIKDTLVFADPHLGYEESLARDGVLVPRLQLSDLFARLEAMILSAKPKSIIIDGDIKHDFGRILSQERNDAANLLSFLSKHAAVTLIRGNHDRALDSLARAGKVEIVDHIFIDGFFITHGDIIVDIPPHCHTIVIGHEHPAISIREGGRVERFKCFIESTFRGKRLIVLPSANLLTEGHDLMLEQPISPFLTDTKDAKAFIISEPGKILSFGTPFKRLEKKKN